MPNIPTPDEMSELSKDTAEHDWNKIRTIVAMLKPGKMDKDLEELLEAAFKAGFSSGTKSTLSIVCDILGDMVGDKK